MDERNNGIFLEIRVDMSLESWKGYTMIEWGKNCRFISEKRIDVKVEVVNAYQPVTL
jgi:hypothetical protein